MCSSDLPNDQQKLIRAIELMMLAGQPASKTQSVPRDAMQGFRVLKLGLAPERTLLNQHLNERGAWMFKNGLLSETKALLEAGYGADSKPMKSLGYKQAVKVLTKQLPIEAAIRECQMKTRQYAKRQMTWFRRESDIQWMEGFGWETDVRPQALTLVGKFCTH